MSGLDLGAAFVRGTLWSVGLRWTLKGIGLVSTIILARLLMPEDFGIVAIAMLCVGFIDVLFTTGSDAVVLRDANAHRDLIDSAWTFKVIEGLCVAAVLALGSPYAAAFFHEPRLVPVLLALCAGIAISGFASFGPLLARKEFDFGLEVRISVVSKVITFVVTIALAFWLRSYWALVIGAVTGHVTGTVLTYAFHEYRAHFSFSRMREIWDFSQWIVVASVGQFFTRKADELLLARIGTTGDMGLYSVASDLGQTVTVELSGPMNRALLPVLAQLNQNRERLQHAVGNILSASNILILPAGFGLAAVSTQAVEVLLGPKWGAAEPLLAIFSLAWAIRYMVGPYAVLFVLSGKPRMLGLLTWVEAGVLILAGVLLIDHGMYGLVWARTIAAGVATGAWIVAGNLLDFGPRKFLASTWRPLCGSILMFGLLKLLPADAWAPWGLVDLLGRIAVGITVYSTWILLTWQLLKRPDGIESRAFALVRSFRLHLPRGL
jgi:O-antigen/teichoic acid export membrane protein